MAKWLIISDTHGISENVIRHIMRQGKIAGAERVIHCGDIEPQHVNAELFLNLPVHCALNEEQVGKPGFHNPPVNWNFTEPMAMKGTSGRYRDISTENCTGTRCYIGHKRSFDFLKGDELEFGRVLSTMRKENDGLRYAFSGHTHHQIYFQTKLTNFINPGAVESSYDGYEFAVVDTEKDEVSFRRIPHTTSTKQPFSVGVISDTLKISESDSCFWAKLATEFKSRSVSSVIHCGNIFERDIGRDELSDFQIYYYLSPTQRNPKSVPSNWHLVEESDPLVEINGYQFLIQFDLALKLLNQSEVDMHKYILETKQKFQFVDFILYGSTPESFLEEQEVRILNPGDAFRSRNFVVVDLPTTAITFGHVPVDPLPELK